MSAAMMRCLWGRALVALLGALNVAVSGASPAWAGITELISVSSMGEQSNGASLMSRISADGRFVAFMSSATNLVPGDTNGVADIFVRDRLTGTTERVSVSSSGEEANGESLFSCLSADGQLIAFDSYATNLVSDDTNGVSDVFVRDSLGGTTQRVSVSSTGEQGNGDSSVWSINPNGRFVGFTSYATNLVAGDTNGASDAFVRDRLDRTTECVSVSGSEEQGNSSSGFSTVSADGSLVAFSSEASNLVPSDTNAASDVFLRDRQAGTTELVSVSGAGQQGNRWSRWPVMSADGRFVAFISVATNLVPADADEWQDVFVHDRQTGATELISVSSGGVKGNDDSSLYDITPDGRFVGFGSYAVTLVPGDTNGQWDAFVRDRQTGITERISVSSNREQGKYGGILPALSADGRFAAFDSFSDNLVASDTNGDLDIFVRDRAPDPPELLVGAGAACTNSTQVGLSVSCGECAQARFRNDPGTWSAWEPCAPAKSWSLPTGDGTKRVCVQGRDAWMNESVEQCDEILLDTTPPSGVSVSINGGATCTESAGVTLTVSAVAATGMRFRNEGGMWSSWAPYASTYGWALSSARGRKTVGFQARDACGNPSAEITDTIIVPTFDDVRCANSQVAYIEALVREGITSGCSVSPPYYCPNGSITRAQMAVFLCRAAGKGPLARATPTFADVAATHWAYGYVERLADSASWPGGAPTGGCAADNPATPENEARFCPNSTVTREHMAKFLCVATGRSPMPSCSGAFADAGAGNPFCRFIERLTDPASWPGGIAVTSGCATNPLRYCPGSNVTRGQMAVFIVRAFGIPL